MPVAIHPAQAGLGAERDRGCRIQLARSGGIFLRQGPDGFALRGTRHRARPGVWRPGPAGRDRHAPGPDRSTAIRLPKVMVPVLSSSRVRTSPAASTARPGFGDHVELTSRSMPAMPMADSRPPMVVGIRVMNSDQQIEPPAPGCRCSRGTRQGRHHQQEDQGQPHQQGVQRHLVGDLLPLGPFHQGIILSIQRAFARLLLMRTQIRSEDGVVLPVTRCGRCPTRG